MKLRNALLACASLCVVSPAFAHDAGLAADAKAFGSRETVIAPSLSPDGTGIAGYGDTWKNVNGFKNWRTSMGDIAASTKWLAAQGIADPKRTGIVGWSYGGYAALMESETDPSLYKAVVAVAPVTDLETVEQWESGFTDVKIVEDFIGSGPTSSTSRRCVTPSRSKPRCSSRTAI